MSEFTSKKFVIPRAHFETCGFRMQSLACGAVTWPDGRVCRFNVRLMAEPGANGEIVLIAEDNNRDSRTSSKALRLRRRK